MAGTARPKGAVVWKTSPKLPLSLRHLKVAAYCRVSSKYDAQLSSLENQVAYYMGLISNAPNWELAGIFADRRTARTMRQRTQFQEMLRLCRRGQIDLILTKSIKRFSRNTLEFLEVCHEFKSLGVEVYFELENLYLSNPNSMLLLTIFAGLAQAESENLSTDIRWGIHRGFKDGSSGFINRPCYGYRRSKDSTLTIYEPEAKIVRQIYRWRAYGHSLRKIAELLQERNVAAPKGGARWGTETLNKLLHNEKYTGSVMLQKTYVPDVLAGKQKLNNGQVTKFYIENTHQRIITKKMFDAVNRMSHLPKVES